MEQLLHYVWKHKVFPLCELQTVDGKSVEVISPGYHNHDAGPDFREAKIRLDGMLWVGSVELHVKASDWHRHHHDGNPDYENIIMHVVAVDDERLTYPDGSEIPQMVLSVPDQVRDQYDQLVRSDVVPKCKHVIPGLPFIMRSSWLTALQVERLELRTAQVMERLNSLEHNWEDTLFVTIARSFGFGKNGDAFEQWAHSIPMSAVAKHRDDLFQIEAIFFGQAGLLDGADGDDYYQRLRREYLYLKQKFSLQPIDVHVWKFLRMRPQNFPHVRIAQLAMLYYNQKVNLSKLINAASTEEISFMLHTQVSEYWRTHYTFGSSAGTSTAKRLTASTLNLLIINSIVPVLFAYGRYKNSERICDQAIAYMERTPAERNHIITAWRDAGITPRNAAESQALIQLTRMYCEKSNCLRCRFGHEYIRRTPGFLKEE